MNDIAPHIPAKLATIFSNIVEQNQPKESVEVIIYTGSCAREDFSISSDVDITIFYDNPDSFEYLPYDMNYINNYLISTSISTIKQWKDKLVKPQELFGIYLSIKDSIILFDRNDKFQNFKTELSCDP